MSTSRKSVPAHRYPELPLGTALLWMAILFTPVVTLGGFVLYHTAPDMMARGDSVKALSMVFIVVAALAVSVMGYFLSRREAVEQLQRNSLFASRQEDLFNLSVSLKNARDELDVAEAVVDAATQIIMTERGSFSILRDGRATLAALKAYNAPADTPVSGEYIIDVDTGVIGDALHTGQTVRLKRPEAERMPLDMSLKTTTRDVIVMPVFDGDHAVAALEVSNPMHGGEFSTDDIEAAEHLARAAGMALAGVWARDANKNRTERLIALVVEVHERSAGWVGHATTVANLSVEVGRRMGLLDDELEALRIAALLHDIGLVATGEEEEMHPIEGARMLAATDLPARIGVLIGSHHERIDGSGYPKGTTASEIPTGARILAAVEAYETETNPNSPYKSCTDSEFRQKYGDGGGLDADVLRHLLAVVDLERSVSEE